MIDLTDRKILINILQKYGLRLQKSFGQHFLIDKTVLEKMIEASELTKDDTVVEIGTGVGVLTQELCEKSGKVIAYELDEKIAKVLKDLILPEYNNLEFINNDFLKSELILTPPFKVVSNLPYQITTPVIRRFLEYGPLPTKIVILIQKEVAERLSAKPGSAKRGWVTVLVELFGQARIFSVVKKEGFFPQPEVDSAILAIDNINYPDKIDLKTCLRMVRAGFSSKRRQLVNSLSGGLGLDSMKIIELLGQAKINPKLRAEDLSVDQWKKLTFVYDKLNIIWNKSEG